MDKYAEMTNEAGERAEKWLASSPALSAYPCRALPQMQWKKIAIAECDQGGTFRAAKEAYVNQPRGQRRLSVDTQARLLIQLSYRIGCRKLRVKMHL